MDAWVVPQIPVMFIPGVVPMSECWELGETCQVDFVSSN